MLFTHVLAVSSQTLSYRTRKVGQKSCDMSQNFHFQVLGPVSPAFGAVREKLQLFHPPFSGSGWGKVCSHFPAEKVSKKYHFQFLLFGESQDSRSYSVRKSDPRKSAHSFCCFVERRTAWSGNALRAVQRFQPTPTPPCDTSSHANEQQIGSNRCNTRSSEPDCHEIERPPCAPKQANRGAALPYDAGRRLASHAILPVVLLDAALL